MSEETGTTQDLPATDGPYWDYRICNHGPIDHGEDCYTLNEVYWNSDGTPRAMTQEPCGFGANSPEDLIEALELALKDAKTRPVFNVPEGWK